MSQPDANGPVPQLVDITKLHASDWNPRSLPPAGEESLRKSILADPNFLWLRPILAQGDGTIYAGHQRHYVATKLGWKQVPAVVQDVSLQLAKERGVRDNLNQGEWLQDDLAALLNSMQGEGSVLTDLGFDQRELDKLLSMQPNPEQPGTDDADLTPPVEPVTRTGDIWILGDHRIQCGDSTSADDVARVMNGEKAVMLATDPPYLVDYTAGNHPPSDAHIRFDGSRANPNKDWDAYKDPDSSVEFFVDFMRIGLEHCVENVAVYQWHASRRQILVEQAWEKCGLFVHQQIIWVKERAVLTRSWYMWKHEPCFMGWRPKHMPRRPAGEFTATSTWDIAADPRDKDIEHQTIKPVEVFMIPMRQHTLPGELCYEPFSGSGTCIAAAEMLGRRCFANEQAPEFVDVAVKRWEKLTQRQAVLEATGQTFAEVAAERQVKVDEPANAANV